jgi:predicted ferric reductase
MSGINRRVYRLPAKYRERFIHSPCFHLAGTVLLSEIHIGLCKEILPMSKRMNSPTKTGPAKLKLYRGLVIGLALLVAGGALSVPFVYESMTLWYKFGMNRTMLRGGQMAGLLTATLLLVQILVAARGKFLKDLFGIAALMRWHKINGIIIAFLALSHMLLVLAPEGLTNLPIGKKYWPEMVGALLLLIILSMAISSQFRQQLHLDYKRWRAIHKLLGYFVIVLIGVHVLFVSDSFGHAVPRIALLSALLAVVVAVVLSKLATRR